MINALVANCAAVARDVHFLSSKWHITQPSYALGPSLYDAI